MKNYKFSAISLILTAMLLTSTTVLFLNHAQATSQWQGYVKPSFTDYAPSGMPDFDEKQDAWGPGAGIYTWCGPVAAANSLWWLDSEYESLLNPNPVAPPTNSDRFALVPAFGPWDDHDPRNVAPLVPALASLMNTDGMHSGGDHIGTRFTDFVNGIQQYISNQGLSRFFEVHTSPYPTFGWIDTEVEKCQDVELFLEFYQLVGGIWTNSSLADPSLESGHFVTCAGVNATLNPGEVLISDPYQDAFEAGTAPRGGREPVAHVAGHGSAVHNDAQYVSQDAYQVKLWPPAPPPPGPHGVPESELVGYLQTLGYPANWHAFIQAAVATSPQQIAQWQGYVKPSFPDYALSGMPDFDEKQDAWGPGAGTYTWCVPVSVANSLWWLDSKYESLLNPAPVPPPTISDHFNLVPAFGPWDDHDPQNVDPLVHTLAALMDTDGQTSYDGHIGTRWTDVQKGIQKYLMNQGMAGLFEVHNSSFPTFNWIDNQTEQCQDIELFLEFYQQIAPGIWSNSTMTIPSLENGHCVTSAGVNATLNPGEVLISDPYQDAFEAGTAPRGGREPAPHAYPHAATDHNDTQHVSQDAYQVTDWLGPGPGPYGPLQDVWELAGYLQTMGGFDASWHTFIRMAVATSPSGIHDIAVTNLTSPKKVIFPGCTGNVTTTVANHGNFSENVTLRVYANMTSIPNATLIGTFTNVSLNSGTSINLTLSWNTTGFAKGNYTLIACADPVPQETNITDNNCTDGRIILPIFGDLTGGTPNPWDFVPDGKVDGKDITIVALCFGSAPGCPPPYTWNANCDVNDDAKVDGKDITLVALHFGQGGP
jgi:hypothetical protein